MGALARKSLWNSYYCISLIILLLPSAIRPLSLFSKTRDHHHQHGSIQYTAEEPPLYIAHRGDKFLIPEHTVPAYEVAMLTNVDYVEPDLVMTKDRVFVCHHDITLKDGTDVASHPEFSSLMTLNKTLFLDGKNVTILNDWLISDFTVAQLSTLRINQKQTGWRPQFFNSIFRIPTFVEYLDAVHKDTWRKQQKGGVSKGYKIMGVIPELKHTHYHNEIFNSEHEMERQFLSIMKSNGYLDNTCLYNGTEIPCSPLVVQCFQVETIMYLSNITNLTLLTLLDTQNLRYLTYNGLAELSNKTAYVGMWKELLYTGTEKEIIYKNVTYDKEEIENLGGFVNPQDFVEYAHSIGIKVGIYTIYHSEENSQRGCAVQCETNTTKENELNYYMDLGVDAFFVEGLSESLRIRDSWFGKAGRDANRTTGNGSRQNASWKFNSIFVLVLGVIISTTMHGR